MPSQVTLVTREQLPDVFRAARRVDAWLSAMEEVVGAAPVETLLGIRRKGVAATTGGKATTGSGRLAKDGVSFWRYQAATFLT